MYTVLLMASHAACMKRRKLLIANLLYSVFLSGTLANSLHSTEPTIITLVQMQHNGVKSIADDNKIQSLMPIRIFEVIIP